MTTAAQTHVIYAAEQESVALILWLQIQADKDHKLLENHFTVTVRKCGKCYKIYLRDLV